jgi:hypothetical protein
MTQEKVSNLRMRLGIAQWGRTPSVYWTYFHSPFDQVLDDMNMTCSCADVKRRSPIVVTLIKVDALSSYAFQGL